MEDSHMLLDEKPAAEALLRDGYTVIPSFLQADDVEVLSQTVGAFLASPGVDAMCRPGLFPLRWNDPIVARVLRSAPHVDAVRAALRAGDLKWLSAYISTRDPCSPPLWWHQDWWCWDHPVSFRRSAAQVAVLCYLNDTAARSGALRVLPGSHHADTAAHRLLPEAHGDHADRLPPDHAAMSDLRGQRTLALRSGDAVVLDYRLLHGIHANDTSRRRDCVLLSFVPAWDDLPMEMRAHLIQHHALPSEPEAESRFASGYAKMLPRFDGPRVSLRLNRVPPASFTASD